MIVMLMVSSFYGFARADAILTLGEPPDGAGVPERPLVAGTTSDPSATLWVVVRPLGTSGYWVQPPVSVRQDGRWKTIVYIGRPGSVDIGKAFEIMAFANPAQALREGLKLTSWPSAEARSPLIEVIRK
jgi:hypothetical protein